MTLGDSTLEAVIAPGIALHDVSALMPRGRHQRQTRRPRGQRIDAVMVHHSGALGRPGVPGAIGAADYVIRRRDFPCAPYHYWLPHEPLVDDAGRLCLLRLVHDDVRAWHTGGRANDRGIGLALQGDTTARPLSPSQVELLEAALPWLADRLGLEWSSMRSWLGWHAIAPRWGGRAKPTCPGRGAERWLTGQIARVEHSIAA